MPHSEAQKKKEEKRIYDKAYRTANRDRKRIYDKVYRESHKEKVKIYAKAYHDTNKERINAHAKVYYQANKESIAVKGKAHYQANKEQLKLQRKIRHCANPEKVRESNRKRRALEQKASFEPINEKKLYLRDGWMCQICKKRVDKRFKYPNPMCASMDHIVPLSKGGTHTYANIQLAHLSCNLIKHNNVLPQGEQIRLF